MRRITLEKKIEKSGIVWMADSRGDPFRIGHIVKVSSCDHTLTCLVTESADCSKCSLNFYKVNRSGYRYETCPLYKDGSLLCRNTAEPYGIMFVCVDNVLEDL